MNIDYVMIRGDYMKIAIAGGSGFIGRFLTNRLVQEGHEIYILTRNIEGKKSQENITYVPWLKKETKPEEQLEGIHCFINLAGENLSSGRWSLVKKESLLQSRIEATDEAIRIIKKLKHKPKVLINASAIGYYGTSVHETFTEEATDHGDDFLADVVTQWEEAAFAAKYDVRVVCTRFGLVLHKDEGALAKMLLPFKLYIGGKLGTGKQWMSWIHIDDVCEAILHCIKTETIEGPVNFTAPNPVTMREFSKTIGEVVNRPCWTTVPSFLLKIMLGEMSMLVLEGQKVLPKKLQETGYSFQYENLKPALESLLT